jgi:hypothetical protein
VIKHAVKKILGEKITGGIQYYLFPELRHYRGSAFNDQRFRQAIFKELMESLDFAHIYETGTFRGTTTEYMADTSRLKVYTVEALPRNYGFSRARFLLKPSVKLHFGDSRRFLREQLVNQPSASTPVFAYLDAHWYEDLPLLDECRILLGDSRPCVLMIDDFAVPDDPDYRFDDYGEGKCLDPEYLAPVAPLHHGLLFPALPGHQETGARRGCTVLSNDAQLTERLRGMRSLRELSVGHSA